MTTEDPEHDFDTVFRRAGIVVPPERRDAVLAAYADLTKLMPVLRNGRAADSEPAGIYSIAAIVRQA